MTDGPQREHIGGMQNLGSDLSYSYETSSPGSPSEGLLSLSARLPPPPPRPPSVASQTQSRRSSRASASTYAASRYSDPHDGEWPPELPPLSLATELASVAAHEGAVNDWPTSASPTPTNGAFATSSPTSSARASRRRSSGGAKRRSSRTSMNMDSAGPTIMIRAATGTSTLPLSPNPSSEHGSASAFGWEHDRRGSRGGAGVGSAMGNRAGASHQPQPLAMPSGQHLIKTNAPNPNRMAAREKLAKWGLLPFVVFALEVYRTLKALSREVFVPLLSAGIHLILGAVALVPNQNPSQSLRSSGLSPGKAAQKAAQDTAPSSETWKHTLATSFLLSRQLAISAYPDTHPTKQTASPSALAKLVPKTQRWRRPLLVPRRTSALPALSKAGRMIRTGTTVGVLALLVMLSWRSWLRFTSAAICCAWASVLFVGTDEQPSLRFEVLFRAPELWHSLRDWDASNAEQNAGFTSQHADDFVQAAYNFDRSINRALSAVQEVELVARGYKLAHPLPPITRLEARDSVGTGTPRSNRLSSLALLSSSSSTGNNLSRTGSLRKGQESSGAPQNLRLSRLRQDVATALDNVWRACMQTSSELSPLVDQQELAVLRHMYSLNEGSEDGLDVSSNNLASSFDSPFGRTHSIDVHAANADGRSPQMSAHSAPAGSRSRPLSLSMTSPIRSSARNSILDPSIFSTLNTPASASASTSTFEETSSQGPSVTPTGHKRLSLLSDGGTSSLGRQSSLRRGLPRSRGSDTDHSATSPVTGRPTSRLAYVSEKGDDDVPSAGETAAFKRLSYNSTTSASTSTSPSLGVPNSTESGAPGHSAPPVSQSASWTPATGSRPTSTTLTTTSNGESPLKRAGSPEPGRVSVHNPPDSRRLSGNQWANMSGFSHLSSAASAQHQGPSSNLHLAELKGAFEHMHCTRKLTISHLLSLRSGAEPGHARSKHVGDSLDAQAQDPWSLAEPIVGRLCAEMQFQQERIDLAVRDAMIGSTTPNSRGGSRGQTEGTAQSSGDHTGFEDRSNAFGLLLRTLQVKLRAAAGEVEVGAPMQLHGVESASSDEITQSPLSGMQNASLTQVEAATRLFDGMRDDLLALSAEWESGLKILRAEQRRRQQISSEEASQENKAPTEASAAQSTSSKLDSPQEADEDELETDLMAQARRYAEWAARRANEPLQTAGAAFQDGFPSIESARSAQRSSEEDDVAHMLATAGPEGLPRPGPHSVYEGDIHSALDGRNPRGGLEEGVSRAERIERIRAQREARKNTNGDFRMSRSGPTGKGSFDEIVAVDHMPELKQMLMAREAEVRGPQGSLQSPGTGRLMDSLGSPLDLERTSPAQTGKFQSFSAAADGDHLVQRKAWSPAAGSSQSSTSPSNPQQGFRHTPSSEARAAAAQTAAAALARRRSADLITQLSGVQDPVSQPAAHPSGHVAPHVNGASHDEVVAGGMAY
ncbi:Myosin-binding domain [Ceraceosorus bombacis]|uniref:Myosin-binding domain n=1 Tax=Ceraceosorus bombacis TaxID=401625 RepID=A0A0P1BJN0_9BASI|nr:Myosin-binding domain [Ceraceosorus bombacis]